MIGWLQELFYLFLLFSSSSAKFKGMFIIKLSTLKIFLKKNLCIIIECVGVEINEMSDDS